MSDSHAVKFYFKFIVDVMTFNTMFTGYSIIFFIYFDVIVMALTFYTVLLKTQPYADITEDIMQSIATASTVGTLLIGFALKATLSENRSSGGMYDMVIMDCILVPGLRLFKF